MLIGSVAAALCSLAIATSANAAPLGALNDPVKGVTTGQATQIDWRGYRHCHWSHGRKWCHGRHARHRYGPRYGYYDGPGINLYFGFGGHRNRHHRWR
jgi:hypothetical protein